MLPPSLLLFSAVLIKQLGQKEKKKSDSLFYFLRHLQLTRHLFTPYESSTRRRKIKSVNITEANFGPVSVGSKKEKKKKKVSRTDRVLRPLTRSWGLSYTTILLLLCVAAVVEVTAQQKRCMRQLHTLKVVIFYPEKLERFPVGKGGNC
jgi:hypothetical protein